MADQELSLGFGLDAFGEGDHAELLGEADHGTHQAGIAHPVVATHEASVDLQHVDGQPTQHRQRREACPEIVHGEEHAQRTKLVQQIDATVEVRHHRALGHLETEPIRREVMSGEHVGHGHRQPRIVELCRRQVDRHGVARRPGRGDLDRMLEHLETERHDEAGLLGDTDEFVRPNRTDDRVVPAGQRLGRHDGPRLDLDDRLEVRDDQALVERQGKALHDRIPADHLGTSTVVELRKASPSRILRPVHRRVRIPQERSRERGEVTTRCDADRRRDSKVQTLEVDRFVEGRLQSTGDQLEIVDTRDPFHHHDELVATEAGDEGIATRRCLQSSSQFGQEHVAGCVPVAVVDQLEAIDVDEEESDLLVGVGGSDERFTQLHFERRPIAESGQGIGQRRDHSILLGELSVGHVAHVHGDAVEIRLVGQIVEDHLEPGRATSDQVRLDVDRLTTMIDESSEGLGAHLADHRLDVERDQVQPCVPEQLLRRDAEPAPGVGGERDAAVAIHQQGVIGAMPGDGAEHRLRLATNRFRSTAEDGRGDDVGDRAEQADLRRQKLACRVHRIEADEAERRSL